MKWVFEALFWIGTVALMVIVYRETDGAMAARVLAACAAVRLMIRALWSPPPRHGRPAPENEDVRFGAGGPHGFG